MSEETKVAIRNIRREGIEAVSKLEVSEDEEKGLEKDIQERDKVYGSTYFDLIESEVLEDSRQMEEQLKLNEESKKSYIQLLEEK